MSAFYFVLAILVIVCGTFIAVVAMIKGKSTKVRKELDVEETRLIQELHRNLNTLEDRMEALETIILDIERRRKNTR
jgi:phage shock protein B